MSSVCVKHIVSYILRLRIDYNMYKLRSHCTAILIYVLFRIVIQIQMTSYYQWAMTTTQMKLRQTNNTQGVEVGDVYQDGYEMAQMGEIEYANSLLIIDGNMYKVGVGKCLSYIPQT